MFCTRCGRENRDDANFCILCGAALGQVQPVPIAEKPSIGGKVWYIAAAAIATAMAVIVAASIAVHTWIVDHSIDSGYVVVDGKILIGADGEPIELSRNPEAKDVTWAELQQFLSSDRTDRIPYRESRFVCGDFAETLFNNAEKAGIRAGYVVIDFESGPPGHACNAFETTDRGLVYIDDTGTTSGTVNADKTVDIAVGESFCPVSIFPNRDRLSEWECLGTVSDYEVVW